MKIVVIAKTNHFSITTYTSVSSISVENGSYKIVNSGTTYTYSVVDYMLMII